MHAIMVGAVVYCVVAVALLIALSFRREIRQDEESQLGDKEDLATKPPQTSEGQKESAHDARSEQESRRRAA